MRLATIAATCREAAGKWAEPSTACIDAQLSSCACMTAESSIIDLEVRSRYVQRKYIARDGVVSTGVDDIADVKA